MVSSPSSEGKYVVADPADVVAGDRLGAEEPVLLQRRVGAAVGVLRADPGLLAAPWIAASGCSGVLLMCDQSTSVVMPALRHSSDPARLLRVDVLGPVQRGERVEDLDEVVVQRGVGRAVADRGLPRVPVGVDEAGDDDLAGAVDDLGVGLDARRRRPTILSSSIRTSPVVRSPIVRVHREDGAALEEDLAHGADPFLIDRTVRTVACSFSTTRGGGPPRRACLTVGMTRSSSASANGSGHVLAGHPAYRARRATRSPRRRRSTRRWRPNRPGRGSPRPRPAGWSSPATPSTVAMSSGIRQRRSIDLDRDRPRPRAPRPPPARAAPSRPAPRP